MAQSNIAREPSMDEILASIRKIIESNELGPIGSSEDVTLVDEAEALEAEPAAPVVSMPVAAQLHVEPVQELSAVETEEHPAEAVKSMSLADVAARVRAASEQRFAENTARAEEPVAVQPARAPFPVDTASTVRVAPVKADVAVAAVVEAPKLQEEPKVEVADSPVSASASVAIIEETAAAPLLSEETGQHVAQSFSDLAVAISSSPRRSFDEIAQEMLRPMLAEWLDDNLPKLVERLVREEIERVARGPRR